MCINMLGMDCVAAERGVNIIHKLNNNGNEIKYGPYSVDGVDFQNDVIYEFDGCFWHFCEKCQTLSDNPDTAKRQLAARIRTETKRKFLESEGFTVVTMAECEYMQELVEKYAQYARKYLPPFAADF